jgi:hypothetical protein
MAKPEPFRRRDQLAAPLLLALLVALVAAVLFRRSLIGQPPLPQQARLQQRDAVLFERFSARHERIDDTDMLSVSLRLRTSASVSLPCYVFVVARNDQASPKVWAIWPPQPPGPAITASGHFHGATPSMGSSITLSDQWERLTASIPQPSGSAPFDTVSIYVVDPEGRILLARPFKVV